MIRTKWFWMISIVLVFVCAVAFADDADAEIGKTIDTVWTNLFYVIGVVLAGFITKCLSKLASKYGVELKDKQKEQIAGYTQDAIAYANEWATKRVKDKIKTTSADKFNRAVKKLSEKIPFLTEEKARDLVVSGLPKFRALIESKAAEVGR